MTTQRLIILGGFAGAGKTTIARRLAKEYSFFVFSSDDLNAGLRPLLNLDFHAVSPIAYGLLWSLLRNQLRQGLSAVVDTNMCSDYSWRAIDAIKKEFPNVDILPLILECTLAVHQQRSEHRGRTENDYLNLGGDSWDDVVFKFDYIQKLQRPDIVRIDANGTPEETYRRVLDVSGLEKSGTVN